MKRYHVTLVLVLMSLLNAVSGKAQNTLAEAKKAIAASNAIYFSSFATNNESVFTNCYAEDCWIMPPGSPSLCGPDAPAEFFKKAYRLGLRDGKFITIDVYGVSKDVVAEIGFWTSINAKKEVYDTGKYLVLWKKTKRGWKMWRDSFSSDTNQQ